MAVALITGAGREREIGTAVCRTLAAQGHDVAFTLQPGRSGDALARELEAAGAAVAAIEADLADADVAAFVLDEVAARLGRAPSILINNAAHSTRDGYAALDAATLDAHYAVNVRAPVLLSCELARRHEAGTPGRIVCLISGQSLGPMPGELAYATTKGALETFTRQLAAEVMALGITVNAVNPGPTDSGWMDDRIRADVLARTPGGRVGMPEDAARLIGWLCSEDAGWVTGQVIASEGGFVRG